MPYADPRTRLGSSSHAARLVSAANRPRVYCGAYPTSEECRVLYELRIYECAPGRLPALQNRFRTITTRKFAEHGVKVIGYWTDKYGESHRLTYIVQWESEAERDRKWGAFQNDPEWQKARAASEAPENGGPIVARVINTLMQPTDYSALA